MRLLATVTLFGEKVVPWSAPKSFQGGKPGGKRHWVHQKDKRLKDWQDRLRVAHREQYGQEPFCGPVMLAMTFHKGTKDKSLWGKRWWSPKAVVGHPDITNLTKGAEDAITTWRQWKGKLPNRVLVQEIPGVIENDSQTCDMAGLRKRYGPEDGIEIKVYALEGDE